MKKSNFLLLYLMIIGSCECGQEPLQEVLGNPCYTDYYRNIVEVSVGSDEYEQMNLGECTTGHTDRDKDGNLMCVGEIESALEICDGLDNNCDGSIDTDWNNLPLYLSPYNSENTCVGLGVCRYAEQVCINSQWICEYPSSYGEEVCDGVDNDCDGERDEDTEEDPIFEPDDRYVYTADTDTINVGECRAGYKECVNGREYIRNMRTPVPEICGNDDDDDCDGYTDEREDDDVTSDFALIIDYSGSMSDVIDSVADALCDWSTQGVLTSSRFAVIGIGYTDSPYDPREMKVLTDFTDAGTACHVIRTNNVAGHSGGLELQLNATFNASDPNAVSGYVNWSSSTRKVLIFSDEILQQDFQPTVEDAVDMVVQQCTEQGYIIGAFIEYDIQDQPLWVDMTQRCNGFIDYLSRNPQQMIDTLNYWVGTDC